MKTERILKIMLALATLFVAHPALADVKVTFSQGGFYDPNTGVSNGGTLTGSLILHADDPGLLYFYDTLVSANVTYTDDSGTQLFNSIVNGSGSYDNGGYFFGFSLQNGQYTLSSNSKAGAGDLFSAGSGLVSHSDYGPSFSVSPTPEPASWALLLLGLGMVGAAMRRRSAITPLFARALPA